MASSRQPVQFIFYMVCYFCWRGKRDDRR